MMGFESGARKLIPAVLIYARSAGRILMLHRNAPDRVGDYHSGKWNGLGGKLEPDESPRQAARREFNEECGLDIDEESFQELGWLQFPNFKAHEAEDWLVFVFILDLPPEDSERNLLGPEGTLHWIPEADLLTLELWPGDRHFIPHVQARRMFTGTLWYDGPKVSRFDVRTLELPVPLTNL